MQLGRCGPTDAPLAGGHPCRARRGSGGRPCVRNDVRAAGLLDSWRRGREAQAREPEQAQPKEDPIARQAEALLASLDEVEAEDLCTPDCVTEVHNLAEFNAAIGKVSAKTLTVVDFYKTSCGACKYIAPAFLKLCRASCDSHGPVRFLKHNIYDEYDQVTDLAEHLRIKSVPSFYFYRRGEVLELLERFAGGDKAKIAAAINRHAGWEVLHV